MKAIKNVVIGTALAIILVAGLCIVVYGEAAAVQAIQQATDWNTEVIKLVEHITVLVLLMAFAIAALRSE